LVDAIIPVHLTGLAKPSDHPAKTLYDAAQAMGAEYGGENVAQFPNISAFSLHPLKNLNVWGDAGMVATDSDAYATDLRLLRNHGLADRDTVEVLGYNSRLDSIQAIVACHGMKQIDWITDQRIRCANRYDVGLKDCPGVKLPARDPKAKQVYHTYVMTVENREKLQQFLAKRGIQTKIHYPIPVHLQPACSYLGYKAGDFPVCEAQSAKILSLPNHQYLTDEEIDWVIGSIREFYEKVMPE
jgi:dTDP-4-amino-4,6-dideoxygalactose transaminase